jgi:hypothetical protein
MPASYKIYAKSLHDHFKVFYANWPPGENIKLGDYGILNGDVFIPEGNITEQFNLQFNRRDDPTKDNYNFKSTDSVSITFLPKGSYTQTGMPSVKASLKIDFSNTASVFFNAAGIKHSLIEGMDKLGKIILGMFETQKWPASRFVVTRLVQADSATIIISGKSGASMTLDAESDAIPNINLADASIKLAVSVDSGIEFNIVCAEGYYPLFGLSGIKAKHWYLPGSANNWQPKLMTVYKNMDYIKTEIANKKTTYDEFYFGDIE